jgi:hypothetical protein
MGAGLDEERFRELLDARGLLRPGALRPPEHSTSLMVFSQRGDACLDMAQLKQHAVKFFATKIGLTVEKRYGGYAPDIDAARVAVASDDGLAAGTRLCFGRASSGSDLAIVEEAERRMMGTGMALLAQRCPTVWLIETEGAEEDRVALLLAAIFASVMLGPIVPPRGDEVYGVRTARTKLEALGKPYR